jgi:hypothetical protein
MATSPEAPQEPDNKVLIGLIIMTIIAGMIVALTALFAGGMTEG